MNVRTRLAVWQAGVLAALLLVFGLSLYGALYYHLNAEVDDALVSWTDQVAKSARGLGQSEPGRAGHTLLRPDTLDSFTLVLNSSGRAKMASDFEAREVLPGLRAFLKSFPAADGRYTVDLSGRRYRIFVQQVAATDATAKTIAISGRSLAHVRSTLANLGFFLGLAWLIAVIACAVISWVFVEGTLRPINRMTRDSLVIAESGELRRRIRELRSDDEFGQLSKALNQMLASLEKSYLTQKRFLADASHELRTPLTSITANIDYLKKARGLPASENDAVMRDIATEVNRMSSLVNQLLLLARSGAAPLAATEWVDLAEIVMEVSSGLRWREPGKRLRTQVTGPAALPGNSESLRQLVIILLDNAFKYVSQDNGEVQVRVVRQMGRVILTVIDNGPGVPAEEIGHVFETFYRASNVRNLASGSGLGLSIARSIVANHGGEIALENVLPGGLAVTVSFHQEQQCRQMTTL